MIFRALSFLAIAAVLVSGATFAPAVSNSVNFGNAVGSYTVKPADQLVVCPGALIRSGGDSGTTLGDFARTGSANLRLSAEGAGQIEISSLPDSSGETLDLGSKRIFYSRTYSEATELRNSNAPESNPQGSLVLSGSSYQLVANDSMRGLAAASRPGPALAVAACTGR
jgi:hypothetical protein